jgi:thiol-disulfide isomerase/thioredoxin
MKNAVAALLAVAMLFGLLKLFQRWELAGNALDVGTPIAAFQLPDAQGKPFALPPKGRTVVINYWASWCGPCLQEMPMLREFALQNGGNGAQLVGIALEDERSSKTWLQANPQPYPMLFEMPGANDSSVRLGNAKGILPFTVLVGPDGRVLATRTGAFTDRADLDGWIADAR